MNFTNIFYIVALIIIFPSDLSAQGNDFQADLSSIKITPFIHSSVQIEYNGLVIQVDPWNVLGLEQALPADIILISDDIGHHLDEIAIEKLRKPNTDIIIPQSGLSHIPNGKILNNGEVFVTQGIRIESVPSYDIILGEPSHPKGDANGYLLEVGGRRIFLAGVTECVPEVFSINNVDIAFMPMNIPLGRMTPIAAAECARLLDPKVVYLYHYDQGYTARLRRSNAPAPELPDGLSVDQTLELFAKELKDTKIEVRMAEWYPILN
jgi:L-ascorbate metabolism protein UlaG (beta-lactamase superfamily)